VKSTDTWYWPAGAPVDWLIAAIVWRRAIDDTLQLTALSTIHHKTASNEIIQQKSVLFAVQVVTGVMTYPVIQKLRVLCNGSLTQ